MLVKGSKHKRCQNCLQKVPETAMTTDLNTTWVGEEGEEQATLAKSFCMHLLVHLQHCRWYVQLGTVKGMLVMPLVQA